MTDEATSAEIDAILRELNECWVNGDARETAHYLHDDVVFNGPTPDIRIEGKAACAESYVSFTTHSMVTNFDQKTASVDVAGDTAVAVYDWYIEYVWLGLTSIDSGRDLFVLQRGGDGRWHVTWRMNPLPLPSLS